jgi:hypothetical protein
MYHGTVGGRVRKKLVVLWVSQAKSYVLKCKVRYTHKTVPQLVAAVGILVTEELAQVSRPQRTQRKFDLVESSQTPRRSGSKP